MAQQARVKIHKMRKNTTTDEVIQEILKRNLILQNELKEAAEEIRKEAQSNFIKRDHPEVAVKVQQSQGVNRVNYRISAKSTDPDHEVAAYFIEAKYGPMKKALRAVKRARKEQGGSS